MKGRKTITIYNVNRRPAEAALGVDLIYRNVSYGSYTFVQYKMLNPEGKDIQKKWVFRPDLQFSEEISRMKRAYDNLIGSEKVLSAKQYRLSTDTFFFKFCRRQHLKVNAGLLAHGHYITLSHLDLVLDESRGPRGGVIVSLDTMERWITRTAFTSLVANGWIGTSGVTDDILKDYIEHGLQSGKSLLIAEGNEQESDEYLDENMENDD
jgi:hypothetical protein